MNLRNGDTIGDYRVVGLLGPDVFRVEHGITKRAGAMRLLPAHALEGPQASFRLLHEIEIHASLNHPNIVAVHNAFLVGNDIALVMELVDGESLRELMDRAKLSLPLSIRCIAQVLCGLSYAHQRGIVHGNISPSHIVVTESGRAKLMDFGLLSSSAGQSACSETLDVQGDIDSLAAVLYEVITGERPAQIPPVPPVTINPDIPTALNDVLLKALSTESLKRFQSADAFREALDSVLDVLEIGPVIPAASGSSRRRLQFSFAVTGLLSALLVLRTVVLDAPPAQLPPAVKWPAAPVLSQPMQMQAPDEESPAVESERPKLRMARHKTRHAAQPRSFVMAAYRTEPAPARVEVARAEPPAPPVEREEPVLERAHVPAEPAIKEEEPAPAKPNGIHRLWSKFGRVFHARRKSDATPMESGPDSSR